MKLDVALIATLEEEFDALRRVFELGDQDYRGGDFPYFYKEISRLKIGFFKLTQRGNLQSASQTGEIIRRFHPNFIVLVGIAGGFSGNINLGDVAVSKYVEYYEYKKVDEEGLKPRPINIAPPSKQLLDIVPNVRDEWRKYIKTPRPDGKPHEETRVLTGFILSGETIQSGKLLLDEGILKKKPIAVETEAGGIGNAIWNARESQYIVIKGISDYADTPESQELREKWRNYASEVSAVFAYWLIQKVIETLYQKSLKLREELVSYLEEIKKGFTELSPIDGKSLKDYYVENKLAMMPAGTWNKPRERVKGTPWRVEDFLRDREKWMVIIGAPFGMGKTSFVKYLAYKYAEQILAGNEEACFPVLVKLREITDIESGFIYKQETIESLLSKIWSENESRKVLVILDGLDEYRGTPQEVFRYLTKINPSLREKVKVIITTRLVEIPQEYIRDGYVRLMPFDSDQVDEFFRKYGVDLNYWECEKLGLNDEEITKPLFLWILGMILSDPSYRLEFKPRWSKELRKSLLYYIFIHSIIKGKHKEAQEAEEFKHFYLTEKQLLRYIAALKNMIKELEEEALNKALKNTYELPQGLTEKQLEPLITSYFYRSSNGMASRRIEFLHKSFQEYLLAEYYYECIKEGKVHWLNVGMPSEETMLFLKGLVQMLQAKDVENILVSIDGENRFIMSSDRDRILENARKIAEEETLILPSFQTQTREPWTIVKLPYDALELAMIHRWIALSVFSWLHRKNENLDKNKIRGLLLFSSQKVPSYMKNLERINLKGMELQGVNLRGASMRGIDLSRAEIDFADLSFADLRDSILTKAKIISSNLKEARLNSADVTEAILSYTNLEDANLEKADFSGAYLTNANLSKANLKRAKLVGANIERANLAKANLMGADLSYANLKRANLLFARLSRANLSYANLVSSVLKGARLFGAKFDQANVSDVDLRGAKYNEEALKKTKNYQAARTK
jgi:uncharacterized protein YjbI with pentapeptide repeats/nucleoside phosphorylase